MQVVLALLADTPFGSVNMLEMPTVIADIVVLEVGFVDIEVGMGFGKHFVEGKPAAV